MEQIIGKLSEIETTAETIMRDALQKKKALSAEMERNSTPSWRNRQKSRLRKFAGILRVRRISACHPCGKTLRLP